MRHTLYKLVILLFIVSFSSSCLTRKAVVDSSTVILPFGDTVHLRDGSLVYGLPLTVINVEADVERRVEKPGPYAKYANDLLGIKEVITQEREFWSITGIRVHSSSELDPSELYVIETNTLFQSNVLKLKREGLILDINPEICEKSTETRTIKSPSDLQKGFSDMGSDEYFVMQSDTAFRLVKLDTTFIKIPYLVEKKKQLTIDQLAEKAAKSLLDLRDGRILILSGEATVFPQDKSSLEEMNRLEKEYLALFAGKTRTESRTVSFTIIPQKNMDGKTVPLFRFSSESGISDSGSKNGNPVSIQFVPAVKTRDMTVVLNPKSAGEKTPQYDKLYYRMPEIVTVNIKMGEENLSSSRKLIYQFGTIMQLPANYIIGK